MEVSAVKAGVFMYVDWTCLVQWAKVLGGGVGVERGVAAVTSGRPIGEGEVD